MGGDNIFIIKNIMSKRLIITESERIHIQQRYGLKISLIEESNGLSKIDLLNKVTNSFEIGPKTLKKVVSFINSNFGKIPNKTLLTLIIPILTGMSACQSSNNVEDSECDTIASIKINDDLWDEYKQYDFNNDNVVDDSEQVAAVHYDSNGDGKLDDTELQSIPQSYFNITDEDKVQNSIKNSGVDIIRIEFGIKDVKEITGSIFPNVHIDKIRYQIENKITNFLPINNLYVGTSLTPECGKNRWWDDDNN